jgi:hypothetical protein
MPLERVAKTPQCTECGTRWLPDDPERWEAHWVDDGAGGAARLPLPEMRGAGVRRVASADGADVAVARSGAASCLRVEQVGLEDVAEDLEAAQ